MAEYIKRIRTESGDLQIDYQALANLPQSDETLSAQGSFADAKATGDAIALTNRNIDNAVDQLTSDIHNALTNLTPEDIGAVNLQNVVNNITTTASGYVLDARQARELNLLIQQRATTASYSATLSKSGWSSSAPYTQTVSVSGIKSTDNPIVDMDASKATTSNWEDLMESWNYIGRITANSGSVTAYCYEDKPTMDITIFLKVVR